MRFRFLQHTDRRVSGMTASFWAVALMWVPAIEVVDHLVSVVPWMDAVVPPVGPAHTLMWLLLAILILAPMGLPSALLCRWLWRLGYRRMAWSASIVVFAATAAIISSDGELIHSLQWIIGASAFAPNILAMTLPVWIVVYPAIVGGLVWIAIAMLPRPEATHAETARRNSLSVGFWLLALLWLPVEAIGAILIQFLPALVGVVPTDEVQLWVWLLPMVAAAGVAGGEMGQDPLDDLGGLDAHDDETQIEQEVPLQLLRHLASSVRRQQHHDLDFVTVRIRVRVLPSEPKLFLVHCRHLG